MGIFQRGETVVMSLEIRDSAGAYVDPASMPTLKLTDPGGSVVINDLAMTKDAVGKYHYDYTPGDSAGLGGYTVRYRAVDGPRTTKLRDSFVVEQD